MFRFTSACCGTKGPCPGQTFDPSSNIQISVNSSRFFSRFIALSNDLDSSKTSMRILYQGGDTCTWFFFNTSKQKTHNGYLYRTSKTQGTTEAHYINKKEDKMYIYSASGTVQPASSSACTFWRSSRSCLRCFPTSLLTKLIRRHPKVTLESKY